jgi:hypothetical protein
MQSLDSTIANVVLPYMKGSMGASQDDPRGYPERKRLFHEFTLVAA